MIGCTEFIVVGLLPQIATEIGASPAAAGQLVSTFAIAFAVAAPLLGALTAARPRRTVLAAALTAFAATVGGSACAPNLPVLLLLRVGTGASAGLFTATAVATAASLAPAGRQGAAMAVVAAGAGTATALGVPIGTALGQVAGWRLPFLATGLLALLVAAALLLTIPAAKNQGAPAPTSYRALLTRPVLVGYTAIVLLWASYVGPYTYVVELLGDAPA